MAHLSKVKRLAFDAGWMRWGWPERVGGLGGSTLLRAYLGEALTARGFVEPGIYSMTEVLAPTMIDYAPPELAAEMVPRLLRGDETWCQGFSEPGTGSNLGVARLPGHPHRRRLAASTARRCGRASPSTRSAACCSTRTGTPESAHRGITALFVDMDTPGITVRPLETMHGVPEFCEVFFDDVRRARSTARSATRARAGPWPWTCCPTSAAPRCGTAARFLHRRLEQLLATRRPTARSTPREVGEAFQQLFAFRARSRATQHRLARAARRSGPRRRSTRSCWPPPSRRCSTSPPTGSPTTSLLGDDPAAERWRAEYLYSRAATIYGGSAEIQRNIVARRLLDLGADR